MFCFAIFAAAYGVTYAYKMHYAVNGLCFWLFLIHLSTGPVSLASLAQYVSGDHAANAESSASHPTTTSKVKKRP